MKAAAIMILASLCITLQAIGGPDDLTLARNGDRGFKVMFSPFDSFSRGAGNSHKITPNVKSGGVLSFLSKIGSSGWNAASGIVGGTVETVKALTLGTGSMIKEHPVATIAVIAVGGEMLGEWDLVSGFGKDKKSPEKVVITANNQAIKSASGTPVSQFQLTGDGNTVDFDGQIPGVILINGDDNDIDFQADSAGSEVHIHEGGEVHIH